MESVRLSLGSQLEVDLSGSNARALKARVMGTCTYKAPGSAAADIPFVLSCEGKMRGCSRDMCKSKTNALCVLELLLDSEMSREVSFQGEVDIGLV